jgi:hypothetical protein
MASFPTESNNVSGGYYMANLNAIAEFLMDNGYSRAAAAGIAGTIAGESGGNPESVGSGGNGLIGWTPPLSGAVTGNDQKDFNTQLTALLQYANSNSAEAVARGGVDLSQLKDATSPTQAATWWSAFEGPLNPGSDVRDGVANSIYGALSSYTPGGAYTQPNVGSPATGTLASFNPLSPSSYIPAIESGLLSGVKTAGSDLGDGLLSSFGFASWKDAAIRVSLILAGVVVLIIGIKHFAGGGGAVTDNAGSTVSSLKSSVPSSGGASSGGDIAGRRSGSSGKSPANFKGRSKAVNTVTGIVSKVPME